MIDGRASVVASCAIAGGSRIRRRRSGAAAGSAGRAWPGAPARSAAQSGKAPWLASTSAVARSLFFAPRLEHTKPRILPRDRKQPVAPRAHQPVGVLAERCARAAARAHAVGRSPARWRVLGVGESRHDGPHGGTKREDLEEGARHRHRSPVHFEDAFERRRADDTVPRTASHLTARADSGPSPLFCVWHDRPPEQRGGGRDSGSSWGAKASLASGVGTRLGRGSHCQRSGVCVLSKPRGSAPGLTHPGGIAVALPVAVNRPCRRVGRRGGGHGLIQRVSALHRALAWVG